MSEPLIPDGEALLAGYLRNHSDIEALEARVAGKTPSSQTQPWVRVTQLDADNEATSKPEWLVAYLFQIDCYAGEDSMEAHTGQAEASVLSRTVRAALAAMPESDHDDAVVTSVRFTGHGRFPDPDYEPARERYILDATVHAHP